MHRLLIPLALIAAIATGCGSSAKEKAVTTTGAAASATATAATSQVGCETVKAPAPKTDGGQKKPKLRLDAAKTYVVTVSTSCGDFEITLDAKRAPKTGGSFVTLAKAGFFDATTFHRIAHGFVIQGGDPKGDGTGGPGYSVVETPPADLQYTRGVVAMAKTGAERPGTSGSQFFVVTGENTALPPDYALLGKVTTGMETVDKIAALPTMPKDDGAPTAPVVIKTVTVSEK
jgi:cyclophilin family peptidyl-prolyl cis-trans isomerase